MFQCLVNVTLLARWAEGKCHTSYYTTQKCFSETGNLYCETEIIKKHEWGFFEELQEFFKRVLTIPESDYYIRPSVRPNPLC
jgi:hypothetical protein